MKKYILGTMILGMGLLTSCSLDETPASAFTEEEAYQSSTLVYVNTVANIYSAIGNKFYGSDGSSVHTLQEFTSDATMLPGRQGDWVDGISAELVKAMIEAVLGLGETPLTGDETAMSETLWRLLENGRGDRVMIVWQNMVGYLDDKKLFRLKGSPALNKDFFGDDKGYTNIDKGRPSKGLMTADFESIIPLLDAYVPDKK